MTAIRKETVLRTVYLPKSLDDRLREHSRGTSRTKSQIVRAMLKKSLATERSASEGNRDPSGIVLRVNGEVTVLVPVEFAKAMDNDLKKRAFRLGTTKSGVIAELLDEGLPAVESVPSA